MFVCTITSVEWNGTKLETWLYLYDSTTGHTLFLAYYNYTGIANISTCIAKTLEIPGLVNQ